MEQMEYHSRYKGEHIIKVTQPNGRVTYDIYKTYNRWDGYGELSEFGVTSLKLARAIISSTADAN